MTFASVSQALSQGYAISNVIKSILRMNTPLAKAIKEAMKQGYNEDQIGEYLEKGKTSSYSQKNQMLKGMTEEEKARGIAYRQPKSEKNIGKILKTAAMAAPVAAAGAVAGPAIGSALGRMAPTAMNALQRAAPQLMGAGAVPGGAQALAQTGVLGNNPQSPQVAQTGQTTGSIHQTAQQPPLNLGNANIQQPVDIEQPKQNSSIVDKLYSGFEKGRDKGFDFESDAFLKVAKRMKSTGEIRSKEDFEKFFNLFDAKKNEGKDLPTALKEAAGEYDNQKLSPTEQLTTNEKPEPNELVEKTIEQPKIEKNSVVSSPNGVGEVKEIRNGQALVEIDGKLHKVKEEDLEPPLYSEDEVANAYDNLMSVIPEEHKSGFISWAGYDEDRNVLGFIPRGGKYEELHNITAEEAAKIKEGKGVARTTGETREGLWVSGEDTRGGVISQIIHDRRKHNKANDDKQLKLGLDLPKPEKQDKGMKPLFDEMSHARNLSKAREKKLKDEEKARHKKEKDEAKKRKK